MRGWKEVREWSEPIDCCRMPYRSAVWVLRLTTVWFQSIDCRWTTTWLVASGSKDLWEWSRPIYCPRMTSIWAAFGWQSTMERSQSISFRWTTSPGAAWDVRRSTWSCQSTSCWISLKRCAVSRAQSHSELWTQQWCSHPRCRMSQIGLLLDTQTKM